MTANYQQYLTFARELAGLAAAEILPYYHNCTVTIKPDGTEVTEADRRAEEVMRAHIEARYPDHGILGEEYGLQAGSTPYQWVLDPVDGTAWFVLGMPVFGTLIALLEAGDPVLGVIHFPVLNETVYAVRGSGCWFQPGRAEPQSIRVSPVVPLAEAYVSSSGIHYSDIQPAPDGTSYHLSDLIRASGRFRFCTDCMQHALVCRGRLQLAYDASMKPWDIAALVPCVEEAGGVVTNLAGERQDIINGGSLITSCHPDLHREALQVLNSR